MSVEAQHHFNYLQLKTVFLALQSFLKIKNGKNVLIRSDNLAAIAYMNKMAQIWQWCLAPQLTPHTEYLAGKDNAIAD